MTTLSDMIGALRTCEASRQRAAVATVVATEGSVYRRAGARSVVREDGTVVGVVSGGCVEGDLLEHARETWETGTGKRIDYDFRASGDPIWGMGLGCNGAVSVWLQPFDPVRDPATAGRILADLMRRQESEAEYVTALVLESDDPAALRPGDMFDLEEDAAARLLPDPGAGERNHLPPCWLARANRGGVHALVFVERVRPRPRLLIFGAGEDARVLASCAKWLDWHVTVADHRAGLASRARFPGADEIRVIGRGEYGAAAVDGRSYVVAMTHNYELDRLILTGLIRADIPYLGMLGPRRRTEDMLAESRGGQADAADGIEPAALAKVHAPIGLDIGAETPEEIALAIMAEAVARRNRREGTPLRTRSAPIHTPA